MVKLYTRAGLLNLASLSGLAQVWRERGATGIFLIGLATPPAGVPSASAFLRPSLPLRACLGFSLVLTDTRVQTLVVSYILMALA